MPIANHFAARLIPALPDLVETYGTPFHIYDAAGIAATHRQMMAAFPPGTFKQYFAVKALPNPHVLSLLLSEGAGSIAHLPPNYSSLKESALARTVSYSPQTTQPLKNIVRRAVWAR
jgi:diaminopimelate decarboxylase/decarboxylase